MKMQTSLLHASAACALALTIAVPVSAQQMVIEEIVVTARKRNESLQEIP